MLKSLRLEGVGPVSPLHAQLGERLNILTGDNGLGKSFFLDVCFWCLTGTWPGGRVALPEPGKNKTKPLITYSIKGKAGANGTTKTAKFDPHSQTWLRPRGRPFKPGLVVYAAVDGDFAVWDPARNYWRNPATGNVEGDDLPRAFQFTPQTLAEGLPREMEAPSTSIGKTLSQGLLKDWETWYLKDPNGENGPGFGTLKKVVSALSHPTEQFECVEPRKVFADDAKTFPVIRMPYGNVAYPHWSTGVKRIVGLAYLLVWTWKEHSEACAIRGEEPEKRMILLVDEIESHLHPKWQRSILPALIEAIKGLATDIEVQVVACTHSPLVLASVETAFDNERDRFFGFNLRDGNVTFDEVPWAKHGDAVGWLTSDVFGLKQARSREAETAIEAAEAFMRNDSPALPVGMDTKAKIDSALRNSLPSLDPFWPRWIVEVKP